MILGGMGGGNSPAQLMFFLLGRGNGMQSLTMGLRSEMLRTEEGSYYERSGRADMLLGKTDAAYICRRWAWFSGKSG